MYVSNFFVYTLNKVLSVVGTKQRSFVPLHLKVQFLSRTHFYPNPLNLKRLLAYSLNMVQLNDVCAATMSHASSNSGIFLTRNLYPANFSPHSEC